MNQNRNKPVELPDGEEFFGDNFDDFMGGREDDDDE